MSNLNLTPGISYRDYVQDSVTWDGTPSPPDEVSINVDGGASDFIENAKNNRLRETSKWEFSNVAFGEYETEITLRCLLSSGLTHAGYKVMDIGAIGLFNVSSSLYENIISNEIETYITITVTDVNSSSYVYDYDLTRCFQYSNKRYQLNNILFPLLTSGNVQRTNIETVKIVIKHKYISGSMPPARDFNLTIGRLWIGNFMPVCFNSDWSITLDNPSQINYSAGLDAHPVEQRRRRRGSFPIENIMQDDTMTSITDIDSDYPFATFSDMQLQCGKDYPLVVSHRRVRKESHPDRIYPDPYVLFGLMSKDMAIQHVSGPLYQTQIDVVELI